MRLPAAAAHVFVDDLASPVLAPDDAMHLARVLRLRDGEAVTVADGSGAWRPCVYRPDARVEPAGEVVIAPAPAGVVTVAFAIVKGDKANLVVQKLTELGVDRIALVAAERSVAVWDDSKGGRNLDRLGAVARAAAMQSRRVRLPELTIAASLAAFADAEPALALAHPGGAAPAAGTTAIAVGPEGGWSDAEAARVATHVDLGPTTLRAETAAITAGVLLTALRDGRIQPNQ